MVDGCSPQKKHELLHILRCQFNAISFLCVFSTLAYHFSKQDLVLSPLSKKGFKRMWDFTTLPWGGEISGTIS